MLNRCNVSLAVRRTAFVLTMISKIVQQDAMCVCSPQSPQRKDVDYNFSATCHVTHISRYRAETARLGSDSLSEVRKTTLKRNTRVFW